MGFRCISSMSINIWTLILLGAVSCEDIPILSSAYNVEDLCDIQRNPSVVKGCMVEVDSEHGNTGVVFKPAFYCARYCSRDILCIGYSFKPDGTGCFLHYHCGNPEKCNPTKFEDVVFYRRMATRSECKHPKGTWKASSRHCQCLDGSVGRRCERYPESCSELALWRYTFEYLGKMFIKPYGFPKEFLVACKLNLRDKLARTYFLKNLRKKNVYHPLKCNWDECVEGVVSGESDSNLWTGLLYMPHLAAASSRKTMTVALKVNNELSVNLVYKDIRIDPESEHYALSYSDFRTKTNSKFPTVENCMPLPVTKYPASIPFSAPDKDNDLDTVNNCAELAGRGWWFNKCSRHLVCSPMGDLHDPSDNQALWFSGENMVTLKPKSLVGTVAFFIDEYKDKLPGL